MRLVPQRLDGMLLEDIKLAEARLAHRSYVNAIKQTILNIQAGKSESLSKDLDNQEHHDELIKELTKEFGDPVCEYESYGGSCVWHFPSNIEDQNISVMVGIRIVVNEQDTFYIKIRLWD